MMLWQDQCPDPARLHSESWTGFRNNNKRKPSSEVSSTVDFPGLQRRRQYSQHGHDDEEPMALVAQRQRPRSEVTPLQQRGKPPCSLTKRNFVDDTAVRRLYDMEW